MVESGIAQKLLKVLSSHNSGEGDIRLQHALLSALRNLSIAKENKPVLVTQVSGRAFSYRDMLLNPLTATWYGLCPSANTNSEAENQTFFGFFNLFFIVSAHPSCIVTSSGKFAAQLSPSEPFSCLSSCNLWHLPSLILFVIQYFVGIYEFTVIL